MEVWNIKEIQFNLYYNYVHIYIYLLNLINYDSYNVIN